MLYFLLKTKMIISFSSETFLTLSYADYLASCQSRNLCWKKKSKTSTLTIERGKYYEQLPKSTLFSNFSNLWQQFNFVNHSYWVNLIKYYKTKLGRSISRSLNGIIFKILEWKLVYVVLQYCWHESMSFKLLSKT